MFCRYSEQQRRIRTGRSVHGVQRRMISVDIFCIFEIIIFAVLLLYVT